MFLLSFTVSGEIDSSGDIYQYNGYDADILWDFFGERDEIDITEVTQIVSGSDIKVSLTIKGGITDDEKITYYIYLYKTATAYYTVSYNEGSGMASGNGDVAAFPVDTNPDFEISDDGNTLSYTFSDIDTSIDYNLEAYAVEHAEYGDVGIGEAWYDYAPEGTAPYSSGGNGNGHNNGASEKGTPGFETLLLLAAIGIVFIIIKNSKN